MEQILHLNAQVPPLILKGKVLPPQQTQVLRDSAELLEKAKEQARQILEQAKREKAILLKQAEEQAAQQAAQALEKEKGKAKESTLAALFKLKKQAQEDLLKNREDILNAIMETVRHILGNLPDKDIATQYVDKALKRMSQAKAITIYLREENIAHLQTYFAQSPQKDILNFVPENKLALTDSVVECDIGTINNRLEPSLEQLEKALKRGLEKSNS